VLLRRLRGESSDRRLVVELGLLAALLVSFSTELALTTLLAAIAVLVVARVCIGPQALADVRPLVRPVAWAAGLALVLVPPLAVAAVAGFETTRINSPNQFSGDL